MLNILQTISGRVIIAIILGSIIVLGGGGWWLYQNFSPAGGADQEVLFKVSPGEGLGAVATRLETAHLIRSALGLRVYAVLTRVDRGLQQGNFRLIPAMTPVEILNTLVHGRDPIVVKLPEGATVYEVDAILASAHITEPGAVYRVAALDEGKLFPDTYHFLPDTPAEDVAETLRSTFKAKIGPLLQNDKDATNTLILASLLEREVPDSRDRQIVAGIIKKRLAAHMRLQVDASVCYLKRAREFEAGWRSYPFPSCYPLTALDLAVSSPYNTYSNSGLPPGPIGSPGISAVQAAESPLPSEYWFYLSDPKTKETIYSRTFDEHRLNRARYLSGN